MFWFKRWFRRPVIVCIFSIIGITEVLVHIPLNTYVPHAAISKEKRSRAASRSTKIFSDFNPLLFKWIK